MQSYKSRVLFKGACSAIPEDALLLEIGPHAIMRSPLRQNCAGLPYVSTMKKGEDGTLTLREAVAGLWRKGAALKWDVPEDVPGQPPWLAPAVLCSLALRQSCSETVPGLGSRSSVWALLQKG